MAVPVDVVNVVGALVVSVSTENVKRGRPTDCLLAFKADKAVDMVVLARDGSTMFQLGLGVGVGGGDGVSRSELAADCEGEVLAGEEGIAMTEGMFDFLG